MKNCLFLNAIFADHSNAPLTVGYRTSAAAAIIAIDRIRREHLLDGYEFNFTITFDDCQESEAAGKTIELIENDEVDVIFGPTMNQPTLAAFIIATYYNRPIITWGLSNSAVLDDESRFPHVGIMSSGSRSLGVAIRAVFQEFKWSNFVFAYFVEGDADKCVTLRNDLQQVVSFFNDINLLFTIQVSDVSMEGMKSALKEISKRGRIILSCMMDGIDLRRNWMLAAEEMDMIGDEYVYVFADIKSKGYVIPMLAGNERMAWISEKGSDENDSRALRAFRKSIFICDNMGQGEVGSNYSVFGEEVLARMKEPPFNCGEECDNKNYSKVATYAGQLHDAVYAYGVAVNKSLAAGNIDLKNGAATMDFFPQTFDGMSGKVIVNKYGTRNPTIYVIMLDKNDNSTVRATIYVDNTTAVYSAKYNNENTLWVNWKSGKPEDVPKCGFEGNMCPVDIVEEYLVWIILGALLILVIIATAIGACIYSIRLKRSEVERLNKACEIPFNHLHQIKGKQKGDQSMRSLQSGVSSLSSRTAASIKTETRNYMFFTLQREMDVEPVVAMKHGIRPKLDDAKYAYLRSMRSIDHDNINRFMGLCLDGPQVLSVWRYCTRGSIADVVHKATIQMDNFFIYSLIKDIVNGLVYIHQSNIEYHGMLTSKCCLIDDRWQVKISSYGLPDLRTHDSFIKRDLLWTAPELLRNEDISGSKMGDVYSLGIICAELVTRSSVFNLEDRKEDPEEIIYMLKKGGMKTPRPLLESENTIDVNPAMLHMIRDCWTERPSERPTIEVVRSRLRGMNSNRTDNLMDHVFNMLETYASTLEDEVSERTKELVEEKKKSDILLYRMLPRSVADKLKLGQTVEPETFDLVTIFFSDVVSFTKLAGKCTPLQVVNLLNDLYTVFDNIIEQHDVYKVETIGDGYLCVSGLPHRNGNEHCRHIARMALGFMASLEYFRVPHLPTERINLRIGINCGPVVAGVVGLTMPRYCLFGDAVNTASRMESNGKPGHIHISAEVNHMLTKVVGGFQTESRGDVIIKGKGVMETFWLIRETELSNNFNNLNNEPSNIHSIIRQETKEQISPRSITPPMNYERINSGMYKEFKDGDTDY